MKKGFAIIIIFLLCFSSFVLPLPLAVRAADSGLVGYWKFDEGSGTTAHDTSGNGNDGTITGARWVTGISGSALKFSDTNTYVLMKRFPDGINSNSEFTVSFWIKIDRWPTAQYAYLIMFGKGANGVRDVAFHILLDNDPGFAPYGTVRPSFWNRHTYTEHTFNTGIWYNWAFVYDKTQIKMYQNGTFLESIDLGGAEPNYDTSGPLMLSTPSTQFFEGILDEVEIYNYARSAGEILNDYTTVNESPSPSTEPSANITISEPKITNNLSYLNVGLDEWMKAATHTYPYCDATISVEISPSILVDKVQLRVDGLQTDTFTMTKDVSGKYVYHLMVSDPNNLVNFFFDWLCGFLPGEVAGELPDFIEIEQPKITSVAVTDIYGEVHTKNYDRAIPTSQSLLPKYSGSSLTSVIINCPVDVLITDQQNRRIGATYENGVLKESFNEIPNAYYLGQFGVDAMKIVVLPYSDAVYNITLYAFGAGTFEVNILSFENQNLMSQASPKSGSVNSGDVLKCSLGVSEGGASLNLTEPAKINSSSSEIVYIIIAISAVAAIVAAVAITYKRKRSHIGNTE